MSILSNDGDNFLQRAVDRLEEAKSTSKIKLLRLLIEEIFRGKSYE